MDFDEYVAARGPALLRFAYVLTQDSHGAEDAVQSALAEAFRHWRRISATDHPDAYIRRIIANQYVSSRRRRSSKERPSGSLLDGGELLADHADGIAGRDEMRQVLDGLAPRARAILVLRYYADMDDASIGRFLGIAQSNVRASASRALAALRTGNNNGRDSHLAHQLGER